jgi:hypothetical protein
VLLDSQSWFNESIISLCGCQKRLRLVRKPSMNARLSAFPSASYFVLCQLEQQSPLESARGPTQLCVINISKAGGIYQINRELSRTMFVNWFS